MVTIESTLALFIMLGISSLALFWARRMRIPHTVLLVVIGIGLGFLSHIEAFSFFGKFQLTPELLFYIFLPTLIFESAYNMNIRKLVDESVLVLSLAIGSFLISTILIAVSLYYLLMLAGITVPLIVTLLFGALISATDPVAVLALFKEFGVPKRLSLIFEGESLFNDATAVALFLIILEAINSNAFTLVTSIYGLGAFISMLLGGVLFGLLIGGVFASLVGAARESEVASITLTIVLAHITFILAELISTTPLFFGQTIAISPIISTTIAALLMGNYGRSKIHPRAEKFVAELWEQFAFMANSLVFILIGVLMSQTPLNEPIIFYSIGIAILVVASARALSIYPVVFIYNLTNPLTKQIPAAWQHLLAWGSLRGALSVTMVLIIPDTFIVPGWELSITPKEFLLTLTIGCIGATLFIKALSIKSFVRKFNLNSLTPIEEMEYQEAQALIHHHVTNRLQTYQSRGYIDSDVAQVLLTEHTAAFKEACKQVASLSEASREDLSFRVLRIFAIGIEKRHLKKLYHHNEINEQVYRRILGKLQLQLEAIEDGNMAPDLTLHVDSRDVFERMAACVRQVTKPKSAEKEYSEQYMYYRAQTIISRKVIKEFAELQQVSNSIFTTAAVKHVTEVYTTFKKHSTEKLVAHAEKNPEKAKALGFALAQHGVNTIEEAVLDDIYRKELITQKLYINLKEEMFSTK